MYFIPIRITCMLRWLCPTNAGTEHKRHKRTQKAQIKRAPGSFCASCVLFCAFCVLFPIPLGKGPISRMTFSINCSDAICHIWQRRVSKPSDSSRSGNGYPIARRCTAGRTFFGARKDFERRTKKVQLRNDSIESQNMETMNEE